MLILQEQVIRGEQTDRTTGLLEPAVKIIFTTKRSSSKKVNVLFPSETNWLTHVPVGITQQTHAFVVAVVLQYLFLEHTLRMDVLIVMSNTSCPSLSEANVLANPFLAEIRRMVSFARNKTAANPAVVLQCTQSSRSLHGSSLSVPNTSSSQSSRASERGPASSEGNPDWSKALRVCSRRFGVSKPISKRQPATKRKTRLRIALLLVLGVEDGDDDEGTLA